jgi:hypothetical protein
VRVLGLTLAGVRFDGILDGPGPIVLNGRMTIETFLHDISWHETFTIGHSGGDTRITPRSLLDELAPELARPENLRAQGGFDSYVSAITARSTRIHTHYDYERGQELKRMGDRVFDCARLGSVCAERHGGESPIHSALRLHASRDY